MQLHSSSPLLLVLKPLSSLLISPNYLPASMAAAPPSDIDVAETEKSESFKVLEGSMEQLNLKTDPPTSSLSVESDLNDGDDDIDFWGEDETIDNTADNGLNHSSALDREWQMRHEQFHTMGYRDGITAGKEASAQEGFNVGFKQSVRNGYNWGLVRGISSVYANLPNHLKEKLGGRVEKRERLQNLYQNVQTISTTDALKMFHQSIQKTETRVKLLESDSHLIIENEQHSSFNQLDSLHMELTSLLKDSPEIKITMEPA